MTFVEFVYYAVLILIVGGCGGVWLAIIAAWHRHAIASRRPGVTREEVRNMIAANDQQRARAIVAESVRRGKRGL